MKKFALLFCGIALVVSGLMVGCSSPSGNRPVVVTPTGDIVVQEAPPEPRQEEMGAPPNPSFVWMPGYYTYSNSRWVWIPGRWQHPPATGNTWVSGHWDKTPRGWVWTPGHWE